MMNKKKVFLIIMTLSLVLGGCSMFNSDERYIEKQLKEKYGVRFKVTNSKEINDEVKYYGNEIGNNKRKVVGIYDKEKGFVTDTYVDAIVTEKFGEYLTDEMQTLIPGIVVIAGLAEYRDAPSERNTVDVSIDEWLKQNHDDYLEGGERPLAIKVVFLIPENLEGKINFEECKLFMTTLIDTKVKNLGGLIVERGYYYSADQFKDKYIDVVNVGYYETTDLGTVHRLSDDSKDNYTIQRLNRLISLKYFSDEYRDDLVLEFKNEGIE